MSTYANEAAYQGHLFFSLSGKAKVLTGDCSVNDLCKTSLSLVIKDEEPREQKIALWALNAGLNIEIPIQLSLLMIFILFPI